MTRAFDEMDGWGGGESSKTAKRLSTRAFHRSAYRYYATHTVPSPFHPAKSSPSAAQ